MVSSGLYVGDQDHEEDEEIMMISMVVEVVILPVLEFTG